MTNLIFIQILNSLMCSIILKMPSDLMQLICYAAIDKLQAVGTEIGLFFSYSLLPDSFDSKTHSL